MNAQTQSTPQRPAPAIEAQGLTKRFGDFVAVDSFDLTVPTGSVLLAAALLAGLPWGLARFTELDEQFAFAEIMYALDSAISAGRLEVEDPPTLTRLLLGALTRGAMLVANSDEPERTRQSVARTMRALLASFAPRPD